MFKRLSALATLAIVAGCTGGDTFKPSAVISDVRPNSVAQGRSLRVEIVGDFTKWKESKLEATDVTFGEGITVDSITVSNEGFLFVDITVAADAVPGARDIDIDGEVASGVFAVVLPFELSQATLSQGGYAFVEIFGNGTDWVAGLTEVTIGTTEVVIDGSDVYGQTGFTVLAPDYIQAVVKVDLFATPATVDVAINGLTSADSVPALTIAAVTPTILDADTNTTATLANGNDVQVYQIDSGAVGESFDFSLVFPDSSPNIDGLIYEDEDGVNPTFNVWEAAPQYAAFSFGNAAKSYYLVFQDFTLVGGITYEFDVTFDSLNPAALATQLAAQQLAAAGDENWYVVNTTKWNLGTITVNAESATPTINPTITIMTDYAGLNDRTVLGVATNNTATFLQVPGMNALVSVRDEAGVSTGADSVYTVGWTQFSGDGLTDAGIQVPVPIPDQGGPVLSLTLDPNTGLTTLTAVHVLLDIRHTWRSDLEIRLISPDGINQRVLFTGGSADNWITAVPDIQPVTAPGNFAAFNAETNPDGVWTLTIDDTAGGDFGEVIGWALIFEGS